eukprot:6673884-Prymnesium_polylepis.1
MQGVPSERIGLHVDGVGCRPSALWGRIGGRVAWQRTAQAVTAVGRPAPCTCAPCTVSLCGGIPNGVEPTPCPGGHDGPSPGCCMRFTAGVLLPIDPSPRCPDDPNPTAWVSPVVRAVDSSARVWLATASETSASRVREVRSRSRTASSSASSAAACATAACRAPSDAASR